jgi:hypothetical protein
MEGEVKSMRLMVRLLPVITVLGLSFLTPGYVQEQPAGREKNEPAQLRLRKTPVKTREYQGALVEGEERVISKGDTLWGILVQEKGLSERHFRRYLIIVGALNPHLKKPDILQIGDTLFIPIRPDQILGIQVPADKKETRLYRVKKGDTLYKILREEFGIQEKREVRRAFDRVKELNRGKKNWDVLYAGEAIIMPGQALALGVPTPEPGKSMEVVGLDYARKLPAQENLDLLEQIMGALGNETRRGGEEVLSLPEGMIHIDRDSYPIIHNPKLEQSVILDLQEKIPPSLRSKLEKQSSATPIVSAKKGASLHDVVNSLLPRLGYQSLPANRPIVVQEGGIGLQVKGEWMVAGPEDTGGNQEVYIISLTDVPNKTPEYITSYLSLKGMKLKDILLPSARPSNSSVASAPTGQAVGDQFESWPADKNALVDAFLRFHDLSFSSNEEVSVALREGIRMDMKVDRLFEVGGKKIALIFQLVGEDVKKALESNGIRAIEFDLRSVSSRELILRLLDTLGERTAYREHQFPATEGGAKDKVVLTVSGFFLPNRSLLLTDREVPKDLRGFFAQKGLRLVRFQ